MYETFFDLSARPFSAAPAVEYFFPTTVIEQARQTLIRIVDRAEGPGLIIGQPGLGKTLLLQMLDHHFQNVFHCIHLASAAIESRKDLLQNVLFELNLPYRDMEEGELRLSLLDFLRPSESCPHGVLLLVDEAHTLPLQLLDEIRMITNLVRDGQPRVRLVLAGDSQLDDVFADPRLDSFNQRIAARCYLEPLNQEQTTEYVQAQIAIIGGEPGSIFTPEALVAIYRASGGIPRLINQVCDHSLVMASLGGYQQLDAAGIEEAWADLQQLPGPWNDPAAKSNEGGTSIVEFGSLDDVAAEHSDTFDGSQEDTQPDHGQSFGEPAVADAAGEATILIREASGEEIGSHNRDTIDVAPEMVTNMIPAEWESAAAVTGSETPDPANENPVGVVPQIVEEQIVEEQNVEEQNVEEQIAETPILDASVASALTAPSPTSDDLSTEPALTELETCEGPNPDFASEEAKTDYYSSNVVQVGWEADTFDSIGVACQTDSPAESDTIDDESPLAHETVIEPATPGQTSLGQPDTAAADVEPEEQKNVQPLAEPAIAEINPAPATPTECEHAFVDPFGQGFEEEEVVVDRYADHSAGVFSGCPRVSSDEGRALAAIIEQQSSPQLSVLDVEPIAQEELEEIALEPVASDDEPHQSDACDTSGAKDTDSPISDLASTDEFTAQALANNVFDTSSLSEWLFESTTETVVAVDTEADDATQTSDNATTHGKVSESVATSLVETADNVLADDVDQVAIPLVGEEQAPSFLQVHDGPQFNDDRDMIEIDEDQHDGVFLTQSGDDLARRVEYQQLFSQLREG